MAFKELNQAPIVANASPLHLYGAALENELEPKRYTPAAVALGVKDGLGIIDVNTSVVINGTTTIANSFPACYLINDASSPTDYNIFLPAAAAVGAIVYFRVAHTATKLFTIFDSAASIDGGGDDRRLLWAGESCMLLKTASGWTKIGGVSKPMAGFIHRTASQTLAAGPSYAAVAFTTEQTSGPSCLDVANSCFKARRTGLYKFTLLLPIAAATGVLNYAGLSYQNTGNLAGNPIPYLSVKTQVAGEVRTTHNITSGPIFVSRNSLFGAYAYLGASTGEIEYAVGVLVPTLAYEEVITW